MSPASPERPAVITTARRPRSLDNDTRRRRYLWTMAVRVTCFIVATVTPVPWNVALLIAAAVLPTIAVMLANAVDLRPVDEAGTTAPRLPELPGPNTIGGTIADESP